MILPLLLGACAQMLPARAKSLDGQRYQLEASGNMFAKEQTLVRQIEKKAHKLCPNGFYYEAADNSKWQSDKFYQNNMWVSIDYKVMQRIVKCD